MRDAVYLGASSCSRRVLQRSVLVMVVVVWVLVVAIALVEAQRAPLRAPTRSLHAAFGVVLPLFSFYLIGQVTAGHRLGEEAWAVARFGWSRRAVVAGELVVAILASVAVWVVATATALPLAYAGHAGAGADLLATLPVAALGGLTYAAWFAAGATFFARGRGRWAGLLLDALLGGGAGVLAVAWPRSHVVSLLGGTLVVGWSPRVSSVVLLVIVLLCGAVVGLRTGR